VVEENPATLPALIDHHRATQTLDEYALAFRANIRFHHNPSLPFPLPDPTRLPQETCRWFLVSPSRIAILAHHDRTLIAAGLYLAVTRRVKQPRSLPSRACHHGVPLR
jgi:hypothetical protein